MCYADGEALQRVGTAQLEGHLLTGLPQRQAAADTVCFSAQHQAPVSLLGARSRCGTG